MGRNPYVFAGGCHRSGTTLLQRMLDHHPMLAMGNDSHFIQDCMGDPSTPVDRPLTDEVVECVRWYPQLRRLRLPDSAVDRAAAGASTYGEFVSLLYTELATARGKPLAGEKSPVYIRHIPLLDRLFPWVKFVHLIRDGRDVALSLKERVPPNRGPRRFTLWDEEPLAVCALFWERTITRGRHDGEGFAAGRYLELRYEALVSRPRETLTAALSFLELPFSEESLEFHQGKTRPRPGRSSKSAWLPPTPGLRDWRSQMDPRDVELFEAIAGDLLVELGYERAFTRISPAVAAVADQCRSWWANPIRRPSSKKRPPWQVHKWQGGASRSESA
jgi:sulfotransferase family protein